MILDYGFHIFGTYYNTQYTQVILFERCAVVYIYNSGNHQLFFNILQGSIIWCLCTTYIIQGIIVNHYNNIVVALGK